MNAKELRIGNYVKYYNKIDYNKWLIEDVILLPGMIVDACERPELYEPIPLTIEILHRCGFEKDESESLEPIATIYNLYPNITKVGREACINAIVNNDTNTVIIRYEVHGYWASVDISFLHQLQNIYFSISGIELSYNKSLIP